MTFRTLAGSRAWGTAVIILLCAIVLAAQNPTPPPAPSSLIPASIRMQGYRTRTGETFRVRVTGANDTLRRPVWGTDVYTDDSDLAATAVHAGLLAPGQEGEVLITFLPGQSQYTGSVRNGVTSRTFDSWPASYRLAPVTAASAAVPTLPPPQTPTLPSQIIGGVVNAIGVTFVNVGAGMIVSNVGIFPNDDQSLWQLLGGQPLPGRGPGFVLMGLRNRTGESFEYDITGTVTGGTIWGDGVYTDDSDLGMTSVHAGLLRPGQRGRVRITVLPGLPSYPGTTQNGVSSQPYGSWDRSYRVELADARSPRVLTTAAPAASISGRITDANRASLQNVPVAAAVLNFRDGLPVVTETYTALTNAQGEYQFSGVLPGTYFITARRSTTARPGISWFPGVATMDAATQLPVRSSEQIVGINFIDAQAPLYRVSGRVLNPPPEGIRSVTFVHRGMSTTSPLAGLLLTNGTSNPGEFEVMLPEGAWDVFPVVTDINKVRMGVPPAGTSVYQTGRVSVDVIDRNVSGLTLTLGSIDIDGKIVLGAAGSTPANLEIQLTAADGTPSPLWQHAKSTKAGSDGTFRIPAVPAGEYRLQVSTPIPNAYVSDIRVGQASLFNDGILRVTTAPMDPVEIILGSGGGTVQGDVRIPSATMVGTVILVPSAPRRRNALLYKQERLTETAREFRFSDVPPGEYKVFAFENLSPGAEMNEGFMGRYEQWGESITVTAGGVVRVPVRIIEAEQ